MKILFTSLLCLLSVSSLAEAKTHITADVGSTYVRLHLKDHGSNLKKWSMKGISGDIAFINDKGCFIQPSFLATQHDGHLLQGSLGFGRYIPWKIYSFSPSIGYSKSHLKTEFYHEGLSQNVQNISSSHGFYTRIDLAVQRCSKWRASCKAIYNWSRAKTLLLDNRFIGHPQGLNLGLTINYKPQNPFSVALGFGRSISQTNDKSGLEGNGWRLSSVYRF